MLSIHFKFRDWKKKPQTFSKRCMQGVFFCSHSLKCNHIHAWQRDTRICWRQTTSLFIDISIDKLNLYYITRSRQYTRLSLLRVHIIAKNTKKMHLAGAHQMELPSPLISWVNPFPSRVINRTIFFCNALESHKCVCCLLSFLYSSISARNLLREPFYL